MAGTVICFLCLFLSISFQPSEGQIPIRIGFHWTPEVASQLGEDGAKKVELYFAKGVNRLSQIFRVPKPSGPHVLERVGGPCSEYHNTTSSQCVRLNSSYDGEMCPGLHSFRIPNQFLEGLTIHGPNSTTVAFKDGRGITGKDLIVFITSENIISCQNTGIYTVGSFCRLHPENGRPLVSTINVCPRAITAGNWSHLFTSVFRSILHAMGFDLTLIQSQLSSSYFAYNDGRVFVKTGKVLAFSNLHFACSSGVPFARNSTRLWDPIFMHSSVMAGTIPGLAADSFIDGATAGIFHDTGWYSVDFSKVDVFLWGFKRGCDFDQSCSDLHFFCPRPGQTVRGTFHNCDFLHQGTTKCPIVDPDRPQCRIRSLDHRCSDNTKATVRCVGTGQENETKCVNIYCHNHRATFALIISGHVGFCSASRPYIYLATQKLICPKKEIVCIKPESLSRWMPRFPVPVVPTTATIPTPTTEISSTLGNTSDSAPTTEISSTLGNTSDSEQRTSFEMRFASMSYRKIQFLGVIAKLSVLLTKNLARILECDEEVIRITSVRSGSVIVGFQVVHVDSPENLLVRLEEAVKAGRILVTVGGETYTASTVAKTAAGVSSLPEEDNSTTSITEIIMGSVFGFILCAACVSIAAVFIIKYKFGRPQISPQPPQGPINSRPGSLQSATIGSRQTSMTMPEVERQYSANNIYFDNLEDLDSSTDRYRRYEVSEA